MRLRFIGASLAILALLLRAHGTTASGPTKECNGPPEAHGRATYRGGLMTPPLPTPKFILADTAGIPFEFQEKTQGNVTLLFFGYTRCPDQCPLHMANIAAVLKEMPKNLSVQVKVVFITTDPARDRPNTLRAWLNRFDERFIGLTGSQAAIEAAQRAVGVPPASKTSLAVGEYAVAHASFVVAYTKDDLGHLIYPSGITQRDWAHDLPLLVNEDWSDR